MAAPAALLGTWKMVSWVREFVATGERVDALGPDPVGYIAYHADGRMMTLEVRKDRIRPQGLVPTDEEKLALFDSMLAYASSPGPRHEALGDHRAPIKKRTDGRTPRGTRRRRPRVPAVSPVFAASRTRSGGRSPGPCTGPGLARR